MQDLASVFGQAPLKPNVRPAAYHLGQPMDWDTAVAKAGEMIAGSERPAFVGLHPLTIESLRTVVSLAEHTRGCLLPRPHFDSPLRLTQPVTQLGTLGHIMSCELILGIGLKQSELPVKLQQSAAVFEALPENLSLVLDLAKAVHDSRPKQDDQADSQPSHPLIRVLEKYQSVGVVLAPELDERVVSQWHRLAAAIQQKTRMAILELPHFEALNARGVQAVVAWRTACSIAAGGVDFLTAQPRPCGQWHTMLNQTSTTTAASTEASADAKPDAPTNSTTSTTTGRFDLIIDTSLYPVIQKPDAPNLPLIRIASAPEPKAQYSFVVPDMAAGMAGRVMRYDGLILRLAGNHPHPLPDLTAALLNDWLNAVSRVNAANTGNAAQSAADAKEQS